MLRDGVYISDGDLQMKMEGVYVWPFRQLRMVLSRFVHLIRTAGYLKIFVCDVDECIYVVVFNVSGRNIEIFL